ncbi:MAG: alpha/beta fold hydrolase [Gammaproteobacteria bacterium]|nr:alpha/beta fold hydrolase [Gammaproteobacteria bacterium]
MNPAALNVPGPDGPLSAELRKPDAARALIVLAHGAGAGYRHANMENIASAFASRNLATLRFNFPFMEAEKRRVDSKSVSIETIAAALETARTVSELPIFLGGHSFGGRMSSHAVVELELDVCGLVFCSFPLHPPKKPGVDRAAHLAEVRLPMLFLSGTRDALAEQQLLEQVVVSLNEDPEGKAELHWLETADHSYKILKRQRAASLDVFAEMAEVAARFIDQHLD